MTVVTLWAAGELTTAVEGLVAAEGLVVALHGLYGYILHIQIIHNLTYYIFLGISSGTRVRFYARVGLA